MEKVRSIKQKNRNDDKSVMYICYKNFGQKFSDCFRLISSTFSLHDHTYFFFEYAVNWVQRKRIQKGIGESTLCAY